jgi:peptidoglycan-associated lipoprotein
MHTEWTMKDLFGSTTAFTAVLVMMAMALGCGGNRRPTTLPPPPPQAGPAAVAPPPPSPVVDPEPRSVPPEPFADEPITSGSLDDLNRTSPLRPLFFAYDSSDVTSEGKVVLDQNAAVLKRFPNWTVTIEGHCDERGTAEYNLALGERRAVAARSYLVSLGIPADRLRIVSYGKEFPFDPGESEEAWAKNRRAHFVITAK